MHAPKLSRITGRSAHGDGFPGGLSHEIAIFPHPVPGVRGIAGSGEFARPFRRDARTGLADAPGRRSLPGPAPEGAGEGAQLRVPQGRRDLAERHVCLCQQLAGDLEAHVIRDLSECKAFRVQVPVMVRRCIENRRAMSAAEQASLSSWVRSTRRKSSVSGLVPGAQPTAARLPCGWTASVAPRFFGHACGPAPS